MFSSQLRVMLYKSYLLKKRALSSTIFEIFLPVLMIILMAVLKSSLGDDSDDETVDAYPRPLQRFPWGWEFNPEYTLKTWDCHSPFYGTDWELNSCAFAVIAEDQGLREEFASYFLDINATYATYSNDSNYGAALTHGLIGFSSESDFKDYVRDENYDNLPPEQRFYGAVQFYSTEDPDEWAYAVRVNQTNFSPYTAEWEFPVPWSDQSNRLSFTGDTAVDSAYGASGFTTIQFITDVYILQKVQGLALDPWMAINRVYTAVFPRPESVEDSFWKNSADFVSTLFVMFLLNTVSKLIRGIVLEKEKRIREGMLMMGLAPSVFYLAFGVTYIVIFGLQSFFITLFSKILNFLEFSDATLVFCLFFFFGLSIIGFGFLISVFFNKAKTASFLGVLLFFAVFNVIYAVDDPEMGSSSKTWACLAPPVAFGLGIKTMSTLESGQTGAKWTNIDEEFENFAMGTALVMLFFDFLLYSFLGWYFDQVVPSEFGTKRPYYFLFTPSYWEEVFPGLCTRGQGGGQDVHESEVLLLGDDYVDPCTVDNVEEVEYSLRTQENEGECVVIKRLRREFDTPNGIKVAVNDLSLNMYKGHITALLGHNGAGKTTTMSMLTGMLTPTSGHAYIMGHSVRTDMAKIRSMMGVCPQHNILFDELTVKEHLRLFAAFKGVPDALVEKEVEDMIVELGLTEKGDSQSSSLSGGQKRKLSVGIALIGGSKVVFLDEPTSGMDPYSRRFTWNVLQNQREGRVIVLTTHFMDEADLLGDRIAIMGEGALKCAGSSLFLKNRYGVGYNMTCVKLDEHTFHLTSLSNFVHEFVPEAKVLSNVGAEVSFQLPLSSSPCFEAMLKTLETKSDELGIRSYGLSVTTLEEVFLRVARGTEDPRDQREDRRSISENVRRRSVSHAAGSVSSHGSGPREDCVGQKETVQELVEKHLEERQRDTVGGHSLMYRHIMAIINMRARYGVRDRKFLSFVVVIPVLTVVLALGLLRSLLHNDDLKRIRIRTSGLNPDLDTTGRVGVYYYPGSTYSLGIDFEYPVLEDYYYSGDLIEGLHFMNEHLLDTYDCCEDSAYGAVFLMSEAPITSVDEVDRYLYMFNVTANHSPAVFMHETNAAILRSHGVSQLRTYNHPMPKTHSEQKAEQLIGTTNAVLLIVIAFCFIPTAYAVFVVRDREFKTKLQQLISGVNLVSYWVGLWLCDFLLYLPPCIITMLVVLAFNLEDFIEDGAYGATWLVFLLYGPACISFTYCCSFFFKSHSSAQTILLLANIFAGIILMFTAFILQLISVGGSISEDVLVFLLHLFSLFPPFCLGNSLFNLSLREFDWFWWDLEGDQTKGPYDYDITGRNNLFMAGCAVVYLMIALAVEKMDNLHMFRRLFPDPVVSLDQFDDDEDVRAERERLRDGYTSNDIVCVDHLRKVYRPSGPTPAKIAVRDLAFGIPPGEVFGLLGINGAGKTSTLSMLAGETPPTSGTAFIGGMDIRTHREVIRLLLGYCPQFDALYDLLSGREHLRLFAQIKGVPSHRIEEVVEAKLHQMDLVEFADRLAGTYSGGNKRKLQVAIALIGDPIIVFLDEPSTGMDPVARRFMWDVISKISLRGKCSMILTTHAMEECEALCSRIGIMVGGRFRCLGSAQHLRNRFGSGYQVEVKTCSPTADAVNKALHTLRQAHGDTLRRYSITDACSLLGKPERADEVSEHGSGMVLHQALVRDGAVSLEGFVEWWLQEETNAIAIDFVMGLAEARLLEKHGSHLRFEVNQRSITLSALFGEIERNKEAHGIEGYNLSQTSLEQIFNSFAAQQEEEQGHVAGLTEVSAPRPSRPDEHI